MQIQEFIIPKHFFYNIVTSIFLLSVLSTSVFGQVLSLINNPDRGSFYGSQVTYQEQLFYHYHRDGYDYLCKLDGQNMKIFPLFDANDQTVF